MLKIRKEPRSVEPVKRRIERVRMKDDPPGREFSQIVGFHRCDASLQTAGAAEDLIPPGHRIEDQVVLRIRIGTIPPALSLVKKTMEAE